MSPKKTIVALFVLAGAACGGGAATTNVAVTPKSTTTASTAPMPTSSSSDAWIADLPPPAPPKPVTPAQVFKITTASGVRATGIASTTLPIVYARVVMRAGNAAAITMGSGTKSKAGIADLVATLAKDGGAGRFSPTELADAIDALGTELTVQTSADSVTFGIAVTKDKLDAALELLSAVVLHPHFDAKEFDKLKTRELDRVRQAQRSDGFWVARSALYRELFGPGHPYAQPDGDEQTLSAITLADVKDFYKKEYVAANCALYVAGDIAPEEITKQIDAHFKGFSTANAPTIDFPKPAGATGRHVVLALKPGAKQADVFVGMLGLERRDAKWPDLALAIQALGGGMSARLFVDVREGRSLAYSTSANARELSSGPSLVATYAGTQTSKAPKSVVALLENLDWITSSKPVTAAELDIAKVSLETGFVYRLETIGGVEALAVDKDVLGLPGADVYDYVATYRKSLHDATLEEVNHAAFDVLKAQGVVIAVAGDPSLAKPLSHFAAVRVVDPQKGFATVDQLAYDPNAPLDVEGATK